MVNHTHKEPRYVRNAFVGILATIACTGTVHVCFRSSQRPSLDIAMVLGTDASPHHTGPTESEKHPARVTDIGERD